MFRPTRPSVLAAALGMALLAGCGGSDGGGEGSGAVSGTTRTDASGTEVELPGGDLSRIACLTAICGDALAEVGLEPVAYRDQLLVDERFFGPDTDMVEITGAFGEENLEDVAAAEPDLVIGLLGAHDGLREGLSSIAPLYLVDPQGYEGALEVLRLVGELTGREGEAQEAADAFTAALEEARATAAGQEPVTSMAVYGSPDSLAVDADTTPTGSVLAELGEYPWQPLGGDGHGASLPVSLEEVLEVDPDVVFVQTFSFGAGDTPPLSEQLADDPAWSQLSAVRSERVVEVDPALWGTGRGTRTLTLVLDEAMAALYPGAA